MRTKDVASGRPWKQEHLPLRCPLAPGVEEGLQRVSVNAMPRNTGSGKKRSSSGEHSSSLGENYKSRKGFIREP